MFLISGSIVLAITLYLFIDPLFELIASMGGKSAMGTAHSRLEQYQKGIELLDGRYIFGASPAIQDKWGWFIYAIHNMWIKEFVLGGMLAIIAMLAFLVTGMVRATACLRANPVDQGARFRLVLVFTLLVSTQFNPSGTSIYWLVLGMIVANSCTQSSPIRQTAPVMRS
jgi:O-antigen ligase